MYSAVVEPGFASADPLFTSTSVIGPEVLTVWLAGQLDASSHLDVAAVFANLQGLPVVVDLTQLDVMDCSGYRAIAAARQHGVTFTIVHARGEPAHLLSVLDGLGLL